MFRFILYVCICLCWVNSLSCDGAFSVDLLNVPRPTSAIPDRFGNVYASDGIQIVLFSNTSDSPFPTVADMVFTNVGQPRCADSVGRIYTTDPMDLGLPIKVIDSSGTSSQLPKQFGNFGNSIAVNLTISSDDSSALDYFVLEFGGGGIWWIRGPPSPEPGANSTLGLNGTLFDAFWFPEEFSATSLACCHPTGALLIVGKSMNSTSIWTDVYLLDSPPFQNLRKLSSLPFCGYSAQMSSNVDEGNVLVLCFQQISDQPGKSNPIQLQAWRIAVDGGSEMIANVTVNSANIDTISATLTADIAYVAIPGYLFAVSQWKGLNPQIRRIIDDTDFQSAWIYYHPTLHSLLTSGPNSGHHTLSVITANGSLVPILPKIGCSLYFAIVSPVGTLIGIGSVDEFSDGASILEMQIAWPPATPQVLSRNVIGGWPIGGMAIDERDTLYYSIGSHLLRFRPFSDRPHLSSIVTNCMNSLPTNYLNEPYACQGDLVWSNFDNALIAVIRTFPYSLADSVVRVDMGTGNVTLVKSSINYGTIAALAVDRNGNIYAAEKGYDLQCAVSVVRRSGVDETFAGQTGACIASLVVSEDGLLYFAGSINTTGSPLPSGSDPRLIPTLGAWRLDGKLELFGNFQFSDSVSTFACDSNGDLLLASQQAGALNSLAAFVGFDSNFSLIDVTQVPLFGNGPESIVIPGPDELQGAITVSAMDVDSKDNIYWICMQSVFTQFADLMQYSKSTGRSRVILAAPTSPSLLNIYEGGLVVLESELLGGHYTTRLWRQAFDGSFTLLGDLPQTLVSMSTTSNSSSLFVADETQVYTFQNGTLTAINVTGFQSICSIVVDSHQRIFVADQATGNITLLEGFLNVTQLSSVMWGLPIASGFIPTEPTMSLGVDEHDRIYVLTQSCEFFRLDWTTKSWATLPNITACLAKRSDEMTNPCGTLAFNKSVALISCLYVGIFVVDVGNSSAPVQLIPNSRDAVSVAAVSDSLYVVLQPKNFVSFTFQIWPNGSSQLIGNGAYLNNPSDLAIGPSDEIYISSSLHGTVVRVTEQGESTLFLQNLQSPSALAVSSDGRIAISVVSWCGIAFTCILMFALNGTLLGQLDPRGSSVMFAFDRWDGSLIASATDVNGTHVIRFSSQDDGMSNITVIPRGLGVDAALASCQPGKIQLLLKRQDTLRPWLLQVSTCQAGLNCAVIPSVPCAKGFFCVDGASIPCAPGNFAPRTGMSSCLQCDVGTYAPSQGASSCVTCSIDYEAPSKGSTSCVHCLNLTFASAPGICTQCSSQGCDGTDSCSTFAYTGPLCSECRSGFHPAYDEVNQLFQCEPCKGVTWWVILVTLIMVICLLVGFVKLQSTPAFRVVMMPLTIGWSYAQLMSLIGSIRLQWPSDSVSTISKISIFTGANMQALAAQADCLVDFPTTFIATLSGPFLAGLLLGLLRFTPKLCSSRFLTWVFRDADAPQVIRDQTESAFFAFLSFAYIPVAWTSASVFDCVPLTSGHTYVRDYVQLPCDDAQWWPYAISAIVMWVIFVIGVPILQIRLSNHPNAVRWFSSSLTALHESRRWWLSGQQIWRLACVLVLRLLQTRPTVMLSFFLALFFGRFFIVMYQQPYINRLLVQQEMVQSSLAVVVVISGLVYTQLSNPSDGSERGIYIVVLTCMISELAAVAHFVRLVWNDFKRCAELAASNSLGLMQLPAAKTSTNQLEEPLLS